MSKKKLPFGIKSQRDFENLMIVSPFMWAFLGKLKLIRGEFQFKGHEYLRGVMECDTSKKTIMKAAQMGFTEQEVITNLHGLIMGKYIAGVLYLFPTQNDVTDFSKGRFQPLIAANPELIGVHVRETDAVNIKRIGNGFLYLRGARVGQKIGGIKKTASQLKSISIDKISLDERDEMDQEMVDLAIMGRLGHSDIKEVTSLSTPSIPDWGIHKEFLDSDQRAWMIKCKACGEWTCLEHEFPECLKRDKDGNLYRACKKCGREILPKYGQWVAAHPDRSKDHAGFHISQLNMLTVPLETILKEFNDPPHGNLAEVYNSRLGLPYIAAENRLSLADIYNLCGNDVMPFESDGPCAMGIDVGKTFHVVVLSKLDENRYQLEYLAEVSELETVHDIAQKFNVDCAVIDYKPEVHRARAFQAAEPYEVFLCDYIHARQGGAAFNEKSGFVIVNRTEICDLTHDVVKTPGALTLPRKNNMIELYAKQMTKICKVLVENEETGSKEYRYKRLGDDHFYHATNYALLAAERIGFKRSVMHRFRPWLFKKRRKKNWMAM